MRKIFIMRNLICKLLGTKRKTTLADMDEKTLDDIFQEIAPLTKINKSSEKENNCDKCGSRLIVVQPYIWMNNMVLCECENCKERCYRKP